MMSSLGHEVYLYGGYENEAKVAEFISVVSEEDEEKWFGHYDWNKMVFNDWDRNAESWTTMNFRAALEIQKRKQPGDVLCLIAGLCQEQIMSFLPDLRAVEWGIGYEGIIDKAFHVFESNAWMHYIYGMKWIKDGRFFDTVIPNSFDNEDYLFETQKDDYLLYLGRLTQRKGLEVVELLAARGHRIIAAGQGDIQIPGVQHVGVVRGLGKATLLAGAKALLAPTFYIEPFGGVVVEAMLSGTPVITTDFGAFTETMRDGIDGYRCHTMGDFSKAAKMVQELDHKEIRRHAEQYLTENIKYKYQSYFERLALLDQQGWYD